MSSSYYYRVPPRFSTRLLNGNVDRVLRGQARLREAIAALQGAAVKDKARGIAFDGQDYLSRRDQALKAAMLACVLTEGDNDEATHYRLKVDLEQRVRELDAACESMEGEVRRLQGLRVDYDAYLVAEGLQQSVREGFRQWRDEVTRRWKAAFSEHAEVAARMGAVEPAPPALKFEPGLAQQVEAHQKQILEAAQVARRQVTALRLSVIGGESAAAEDEVPGLSREAAPIRAEILDTLALMSVPSQRDQWRARLDRLDTMEQVPGSSTFLYRQLRREFQTAVASQHLRTELMEVMKRLGSVPHYPRIASERGHVARFGSELLTRSHLSGQDVTLLKGRVESLEKDGRAAREADFVQAQEQALLRREVVGALRRMGYESVEPAQVLDFNTDAEVVLSIPGQDNFAGVQVKQDGALVYRFLVCETRLSAAETAQKKAEVQKACVSFDSVIAGLRAAGVTLGLEKHVPAADAHFEQLPEKYRQTTPTRRQATVETEMTMKQGAR